MFLKNGAATKNESTSPSDMATGSSLGSSLSPSDMAMGSSLGGGTPSPIKYEPAEQIPQQLAQESLAWSNDFERNMLERLTSEEAPTFSKEAIMKTSSQRDNIINLPPDHYIDEVSGFNNVWGEPIPAPRVIDTVAPKAKSPESKNFSYLEQQNKETKLRGYGSDFDTKRLKMQRGPKVKPKYADLTDAQINALAKKEDKQARKNQEAKESAKKEKQEANQPSSSGASSEPRRRKKTEAKESAKKEKQEANQPSSSQPRRSGRTKKIINYKE